MFVFGTMFCVLCDRQSRSASTSTPWLAIRRRLQRCHDRWQRMGSICARWKTEVLAESDVGVFLEWHTLGHLDCGAAPLEDAPADHMRADAV